MAAETKHWRVRPMYQGKPLGGWATVEHLGDVTDMIEGAMPGDLYEVERVEMTDAEFKALNEFEGW